MQFEHSHWHALVRLSITNFSATYTLLNVTYGIFRAPSPHHLDELGIRGYTIDLWCVPFPISIVLFTRLQLGHSTTTATAGDSADFSRLRSSYLESVSKLSGSTVGEEKKQAVVDCRRI